MILPSPSPKILVFDIETAPILAWVWKLFDENIGTDQIVSPGGPMCAAWKWVGKKEMYFDAQWLHKDPNKWLHSIHTALSEADAVVTQNGDKFDLPKMNGVFMLAGLKPLPPITSIDVRKTSKKLGFISTRLDFVTRIMEIGKKLAHEGFTLWLKVMAGDEKAQAKMERYNKHDVRLTAAVYTRMLPYMATHPKLTHTPSACPNCNSTRIQHRGYRYTRTMKTERLACTDCGAWHSGKRSKL